MIMISSQPKQVGQVASGTFNKDVRAVCLLGGISAKQLSDIRAKLPDDEKYNLRYVVFCVRDESTGKNDLDWITRGLEKVTQLTLSGIVDSEEVHADLKRPVAKSSPVTVVFTDGAPSAITTKDTTNEGYDRLPTPIRQVTPPKLETKPTLTQPAAPISVPITAPVAKTATPSSNSSSPEGMRNVQINNTIIDKDPRRKRKGKITELKDDGIQVTWETGVVTHVSFERLRRYQVLAA